MANKINSHSDRLSNALPALQRVSAGVAILITLYALVVIGGVKDWEYAKNEGLPFTVVAGGLEAFSIGIWLTASYLRYRERRAGNRLQSGGAQAPKRSPPAIDRLAASHVEMSDITSSSGLSLDPSLSSRYGPQPSNVLTSQPTPSMDPSALPPAAGARSLQPLQLQPEVLVSDAPVPLPLRVPTVDRAPPSCSSPVVATSSLSLSRSAPTVTKPLTPVQIAQRLQRILPPLEQWLLTLVAKDKQKKALAKGVAKLRQLIELSEIQTTDLAEIPGWVAGWVEQAGKLTSDNTRVVNLQQYVHDMLQSKKTLVALKALGTWLGQQAALLKISFPDPSPYQPTTEILIKETAEALLKGLEPLFAHATQREAVVSRLPTFTLSALFNERQFFSGVEAAVQALAPR